jgi:alkylation response protein AidB-like acyl-CoA dehydrogenase
MSHSLDVVRKHIANKTLHNADGKVADAVLKDLAKVGYWGLLVDRQYGGYGAPLRSFMPFLTQMALVDPTVAGLASVHGCIGAVDPVRSLAAKSRSSDSCPSWPAASGSRRSHSLSPGRDRT